MSSYLFLLPISLGLGLVGLVTFLWTLRDNQYEDLNGASHRILYGEDRPITVEDQRDSNAE